MNSLGETIRNKHLSDLILMYIDNNKTDEITLKCLLDDFKSLLNESKFNKQTYASNYDGEVVITGSKCYDETTDEWYEYDYTRDIGYIQTLKDIEKLETLITKINLILNPPTTYTTDTVIDTEAVTMPKDILAALEKEGLITQNPLQWIGAKGLCTYFVDKYFKHLTNKWKVGSNLFNVKIYSQMKDDYENSKSGVPKGYKTIDDIIKKYPK